MGEGEGLKWRGRWERVYEDAKQLASTCRYNVHVDVMNLHVKKCPMLQLYSLKKKSEVQYLYSACKVLKLHVNVHAPYMYMYIN